MSNTQTKCLIAFLLQIEEHIEEVTTAYQVSDVDNDDFSDYEIKCKRKIPFPESGRVVRNGKDPTGN